jgi:DNA-directed RNA polymerase specialized sigma24 family protein
VAPRSAALALADYVQRGDTKALASVVESLTPILTARIRRMLARRQFYGRDAHQEIPDLVQGVLLTLLEENARLLRLWDPARGLSLENFVGLLCERELASILRSGRRTPYRTSDEDIDEYDSLADDASTLDARLISQEMVIMILDQARASLSPLGLELLERVVIAQESPDAVAIHMKMSLDAVYAWRSRLTKLLRSIAQGLLSASSKQRLESHPLSST